MSTSSDDDETLDRLENEAREVPDDRESLGRGRDVLEEKLRQAAERKKQLTIRLDADIVTRFKALAGEEGSYQSLINRALHEWLEARGLRGLLREELEEIVARLESDDNHSAVG